MWGFQCIRHTHTRVWKYVKYVMCVCACVSVAEAQRQLDWNEPRATTRPWRAWNDVIVNICMCICLSVKYCHLFNWTNMIRSYDVMMYKQTNKHSANAVDSSKIRSSSAEAEELKIATWWSQWNSSSVSRQKGRVKSAVLVTNCRQSKNNCSTCSSRVEDWQLDGW